jgi:hypothetical protein
VAEEMISGPDLGGGYLHQLTIDPGGPRPRFTFHAQVGGVDANGPPLGPLDPFGFTHPPRACAFGGPRCWHRTFDLPAEAAPTVRPAYNRLRFVLTTLLEQRYAGRTPAVDAALAEIFSRLGEADAKAGHWWYIGGSTAAWLQGASLAPQDIDLGINEAAVAWVAEKLKEYLIEPLAVTLWGADRSMFAARAFVGTIREGARVEWGVPRGGERGVGRFDEWSGDPQRVRSRTVTFQGRPFVVSRPEYAFVRALERDATDRARSIRDSLGPIGVDRELLTELLDGSTLPSDQRQAVLADCLG